MNVIGSSKIMSASAMLRNEHHLPAQRSTDIGIDLGGVSRHKALYPVPGKIAVLDLVPSSFFFPNALDAPFGDMNVKFALLRTFQNARIQINDRDMHSFMGHFVFSEYKPKRFSATVFMMSEGHAAEKYRSDGILTPIKGLTALETLFAATLTTYEDWLKAAPFAEYRIEHPSLGLIYQFSFGKKMPDVRKILNIFPSASSLTLLFLHTLN